MTVASSTIPVSARTPIPVTSAALRRMLTGKTNKQKAAIAACFTNGTCVFAGPYSQEQAARLCDVPPTYVVTAVGHSGRRGARNRTIDRLVRKYSGATLMRALDRATAPNASGATARANGSGADDTPAWLVQARRRMATSTCA
jgi:hypothetical protein